MSAKRVRPESSAAADARLPFDVAAGCVVASAVFVALPHYLGSQWLPTGVDALWALGGMFTVMLGPVAAGLSAYASVVALWLRGDALPTSSRRLHLVTLLLVATLVLGLVSTWGSEAVFWWVD